MQSSLTKKRGVFTAGKIAKPIYTIETESLHGLDVKRRFWLGMVRGGGRGEGMGSSHGS